ncbi:MAG: hypothetical protein OHK0017_07850 [Patescibacteria group bacterium]
MSKKIFVFDPESLAKFSDTEVGGVKGVKWEHTALFGEKKNLNKQYFDITDLLGTDEELKATYANINHDDKQIKPNTWVENVTIEGEKGNRVVFGDVVSTNPEVVADAENFNNVSIEVEATDGVFKRADGARFYKDVHFKAFALLKNKGQGSGVARLGNKAYFSDEVEDDANTQTDDAKAKFFYAEINGLVYIKSAGKYGYVSSIAKTTVDNSPIAKTTVSVTALDGTVYTQIQDSYSLSDEDSDFAYPNRDTMIIDLMKRVSALEGKQSIFMSDQNKDGEGDNKDENKAKFDDKETETNGTNTKTKEDEMLNAAFSHANSMKKAANIKPLGTKRVAEVVKPKANSKFLDSFKFLSK